MNCRQNNSAAMFVVLAVILAVAPQAHAQSPKTPRTGVLDGVGVIDAQSKERINSVLLELEQKQLAMFKVLVIDTTHGQYIADYTIEKAREYELGTKGKDNGLLLVVAMKDRKYWFTTAESLEKWLPDSLTDDYGEDYIEPYFRQGRYGEGIYMAVLAVANRLSSETGVPLTGAQEPVRGRGKRAAAPCCVGVFPMLLMFFIFTSIFSRRGRAYRSWGGGGLWQGMLLGSLLGNMTSRSGGSSWGGFSSGGSSFGGGGFGGGFGGSFGGGGSGGSW